MVLVTSLHMADRVSVSSPSPPEVQITNALNP